MRVTGMVGSLTCLAAQDVSNHIALKTIGKTSKFLLLIGCLRSKLIELEFQVIYPKLLPKVFSCSTFLYAVWSSQLAKFLCHSNYNKTDTSFKVFYVFELARFNCLKANCWIVWCDFFEDMFCATNELLDHGATLFLFH